MENHEVRYPAKPETQHDRQFQLVVNTEEPGKMGWVRLERGNKGKIVGRLQGDNANDKKQGMVVFFDDYDREHLVVDHYAIVMVKHLRENFGFVELGKFGLLEDRAGVKQVHAVYQGEHPLYMADDLDKAKLQHFRKMRDLYEQGLQTRITSAATA